MGHTSWFDGGVVYKYVNICLYRTYEKDLWRGLVLLHYYYYRYKTSQGIY